MTVPAPDNGNEEEIDIELTNTERRDKDRPFPDAFYDPTTGRVMSDPVVNGAGDSFDQSTIDGLSSSVQDEGGYYPNRALKSIIERELDLASNSMRASVRRLDENIKNGWGRLVEQSAFAIVHHPLPPSYYCPITCELMVDPVIDPDGYSYEHDAIVHWIDVNDVSPMTRSALRVSDLRDNNALYKLIQEEKDRTDESLHPSIRRWKASGTTSRRRDPATPRPVDHPAPTAPAGDLTAQSFPSTQAEIQARRWRRSRLTVCGVYVVIATVLVVLGVIPIGIIGAVLGVFFWVVCSNSGSTSSE